MPDRSIEKKTCFAERLRLVADHMPKVRQRPLNPVVTPLRIFTGKSKNQANDFLSNGRSSHGLPSFLRVIPLGGNQLPMPAENRFRGNDPSQIPQSLESEYLPRHGQSPPLIIAQENPLLPQQLFQHPILGPKILDRFLLASIDRSRQHDQQELPRLKDETHGTSIKERGKNGSFKTEGNHNHFNPNVLKFQRKSFRRACGSRFLLEHRGIINGW